jgi:hypothetical protein
MRHRWLPEARSYATRHAQIARIACVKTRSQSQICALTYSR